MIIGIAGKKQSGKDTIAKIWKYLSFKCDIEASSKDSWEELEFVFKNNSFQTHWENKAFATKIKQMVTTLLDSDWTPCKISDLEDSNFKDSILPSEFGLTVSPRKLMQTLGTEWGRELIDPNIWVKLLFREYVPNGLGVNPKWLITDVRFENELKAIQQRQGLLIKVLREETEDSHPSETALDEWKDYDYIIHNYGSKEDLIKSVKKIMIKEQFI